MSTLELKAVSFSYPESDELAVSNVSCRLETGKYVVLYGSNGCGKSSLAKVMAGLLQPQTGEVIRSNSPTHSGWNSVGMLFQNPDEQLVSFNVERELAWGLENLNIPRVEMIQRVEASLKQFDLTGIRHHPPESLSDGQKQLVALAATVVMRPSFLILDEATTFLDPHWKREVQRYARELVKRCGLLWITTRRSELADADEVWFMESGRIVDKRP